MVNLLASLICRPADCCARHCRDNTRTYTLKESSKPFSLMQQLDALCESIDVSESRICCCTTRLQHSFDNVHRCRESCRETSSNCTCCTMCHRIVFLGWVHGRRYRFVSQKLKCSERYGHGQGRWVGDVESGKSLGSINISSAIGHRFVHFAGVVHLHTLFDDYYISE